MSAFIKIALAIAAAAAGFYLTNTPGLMLLHTWATMQHECFHALAAYLTGGSVSRIGISADASGVAWTQGGIYTIISLAGYMGTSAYAGSLLYCATKKWGPVYFTVSQAIIMFVLLINAYTVLIAWGLLLLSAAFLAITVKFKTILPMVFASGLLFCSGLSDISVLMSSRANETDAALLAQHWGLPFMMYPLALTHVAFNIGIWACMLWLISKNGLKAIKS